MAAVSATCIQIFLYHCPITSVYIGHLYLLSNERYSCNTQLQLWGYVCTLTSLTVTHVQNGPSEVL